MTPWQPGSKAGKGQPHPRQLLTNLTFLFLPFSQRSSPLQVWLWKSPACIRSKPPCNHDPCAGSQPTLPLLLEGA